MNKNDLIRRISEQRTVSIKEATKYVNAVLGAIGDMLAEKEPVTIPDFGKFSVRTVPEHEAMNPATREKVTVPEKDRIVFKPLLHQLTHSTVTPAYAHNNLQKQGLRLRRRNPFPAGGAQDLRTAQGPTTNILTTHTEMMNKILIPLLALTLTSLSACSDSHEKMEDLVIRHIKANMYPDEKLTVSEISKPDSTFGVMYMSEHEIAHITKTVDQVTEFFMKKTNNMTEYDPGNGYLAYLANKQMLVAAQINEVMAHSMQKKEFNGWRIRCKYTVANQGVRRKTEEWFFFDKEGEIIYSSFAIPLP